MSQFMFTMLISAITMLVLVLALVKVSDHRNRAGVEPVCEENQARAVLPESRPRNSYQLFMVMCAPAAFFGYTWAPRDLGVPYDTDKPD